MARKKTTPAAPSGEPQVSPTLPDQPAHEPAPPSGEAQAAPALPEQADLGAAAAGDSGTTTPAPTMPGAADLSAPAPEQETRQMVRALVLHDSIYGKCGEVREFEAEQVPALKGAGYIDPHPKAVESAGG